MSGRAEDWGYFDLASQQEIYQLRGREVATFLNKYLTQDVLRLATPGAALGVFLTQKGKIVSEAFILKLPDRIFATFPKGYGARVKQHLGVFLDLEDISMEPVDPSLIHLVLLGEGIPSELRQDSFGELSYQGLQGWAWPTDRFGAPAIEWLITGPAPFPWEKILLQAGGRKITAQEMEGHRIRAGLPKMGVDMGEENLVAEVGLDQRATSFTKGCYLGQETTARVNTQGHVNRRLTCFHLEKPIEAPLPLEVFQGGKAVGRLSSAIADEKGTCALGMMQTKAVESDEPLSLANGQTVEVVAAIRETK